MSDEQSRFELNNFDDERKGLFFHCPGCGSDHCFIIEANKPPVWNWNGDLVKGTFTPSILTQWYDYQLQKKVVCHSFVTNGQIQFLGDCTHELAGKTVDVPVY